MNYVGQSFFSARRGLRVAVVAAVVQLTSAFLPAATASAAVVAVESTRVADVVLLGSGFNAGLRQGMVCRVTRGLTEIGEILLVELRPSSSAALILSVAPKQSIRSGDLAAIKVLKS
jgi:hypothetical protein